MQVYCIFYDMRCNKNNRKIHPLRREYKGNLISETNTHIGTRLNYAY